MTKPPMTDFEKQRLLDLDVEAQKLADEYEHVQIMHLGEYEDDPFIYTKELLTALCEATGRPVPSDEEIRAIVERAKNDINKNPDH